MLRLILSKIYQKIYSFFDYISCRIKPEYNDDYDYEEVYLFAS
jgi:hypothetical protein